MDDKEQEREMGRLVLDMRGRTELATTKPTKEVRDILAEFLEDGTDQPYRMADVLLARIYDAGWDIESRAQLEADIEREGAMEAELGVLRQTIQRAYDAAQREIQGESHLKVTLGTALTNIEDKTRWVSQWHMDQLVESRLEDRDAKYAKRVEKALELLEDWSVGSAITKRVRNILNGNDPGMGLK